MIKLIASDLDGTLLRHGAQELPEGVCDQIHRLTEMGIIFVAASGRQYANLRRLFAPVQDEIAYICENGCMAYYKGRRIYKETMDDETALRLMRDIWEEKTAEILLSGEDTSYIQPKKESYLTLLRDVVKNNVTVVDDIFEKREAYFKISLFDEAGLDAVLPKWQGRYDDELKVVVSGHQWLDFMTKGVHKGLAVKRLQEFFGISPEECMAFGDNYNDVEMLQNVKYNYVMDTAPREIRDTTRYITHTVEEVLEMVIESCGSGFAFGGLHRPDSVRELE